MLSDKINTILETMDVTISDVARAGGCTPSNLNRVKNGVRTPPESSPTIRFLVDGFMAIAGQRHMRGELISLCGADLKDSDEILRSKLIQWLYEDEPPYVRTYQKQNYEQSGSGSGEKTPSVEFAKNLDELMKTAGISNRRLGHETGLDPSYISRLRRGERIPRYQSAYLIRICQAVLESMKADGKLEGLSGLTSLTPEELTGEDGIDGLRRWLFGYGAVTRYMAADELMGTIGSIDDMIRKAHEQAAEGFDIEEILKKAETEDRGVSPESEEKYIGINGLRAAVTRFLTDMIRCGDKELLLYSDQSMEWMDGEYRKVLTALMAELIRRDVMISAIHTVNRSLAELISAIEWWMPLYLSGRITSYYCMPSAGRRFSHTLFIRPGKACIAGTSVVGLERRAIYSYSEDAEVTGLAEEAFSRLLQDSSSLVDIEECSADTPEDGGYIQTDKVMVKADADRVIIRRTEPPYLMFKFTHPMIVRAFRSYMKEPF